MTRYNDKLKVTDHYDRVSPYYQQLWGAHIHHGYWISGEETKEQAQIQMIEHLAGAAGLEPHSKIVDVGCGLGGSSIYLAKNYVADATGITISPIQVEMARKAAASEGVNAKFLLMDAEEMKFDDPFEVVWSIESISHYPHRERFFAAAARCLKPGGTLAITDWFKKEDLTQREYKKFMEPIEKSMLVVLENMGDYDESLRSVGLQVTHAEILNQHCSRTWDLCLDMLKKKALWRLAAENGLEFVDFLRGFSAMRAGYKSGNFVYGLMVAKKI